MNRINDWKPLLKIANEDLKPYGYEVKIIPDGMGAYDCDIYLNGKKTTNYAGCYYEDELSELVNDAWHYVKTELIKQ